MVINKLKIVIIIIVIALISSCKSCKNTICADANNYSFNINVQAYPSKDSIQVGDTIWLESNSPTQLKDSLMGNVIDYSGAKNLGTLITLLQFGSGANVIGAIKNFNINAVKGARFGNSTDPSSNEEYLFIEENNSFKLKIAIIAKDTGRFVLSVSNAAGVYKSNDVCTKASFEIDFQNTDQHFYLLQLWRPDLMLDELGKPKVYYFKVY